MDKLPEIRQAPRPQRDSAQHLNAVGLLDQLEEFLAGESGNQRRFLESVVDRLRLDRTKPSDHELSCSVGFHYNVPLMNALVYQVCVEALAQAEGKEASLHDSPATDLFVHLTTALDFEGFARMIRFTLSLSPPPLPPLCRV